MAFLDTIINLEVKMGNYLKSPWNWIHLFGSYFLVSMIFVRTSDWIASSCFSLALGFAWEVFDEINKRMGLNIWFLDKAGFDWRDIVMDAIGISLFNALFWGVV